MMMLAVRNRTDAELAAVTADDPRAFGELYRRHERMVLAYFLHWSGSPELAADLTAETFAAALGSVSGYRSERGEVRAWLFGIARHVLARSVERGRVEDEAPRRLGMPPVLIDDGSLERIEEVASMNGAVLQLLEELPEPIRAAVTGLNSTQPQANDATTATAGRAKAVACSRYWAQKISPAFRGLTKAAIPVCGYSAKQVRAAYGLTSANTGKGKTIALIQVGAPDKMFQTLTDYAKANGLPAPRADQYREQAIGQGRNNKACINGDLEEGALDRRGGIRDRARRQPADGRRR
jgi:DNA-directed RNA polymerase specialized sigma24 family protein